MIIHPLFALVSSAPSSTTGTGTKVLMDKKQSVIDRSDNNRFTDKCNPAER